jgi:hypothetical protein
MVPPPPAAPFDALSPPKAAAAPGAGDLRDAADASFPRPGRGRGPFESRRGARFASPETEAPQASDPDRRPRVPDLL